MKEGGGDDDDGERRWVVMGERRWVLLGDDVRREKTREPLPPFFFFGGSVGNFGQGRS